jgi:hypothetical protein
MKIKFIGNTSDIIDWDRVIQSCKNNFDTADKNTVTSVVDRSEAGQETEDNWLLNNYRSVIGTWKNSGYNLSEIVWYDYYPGQHFPIEVQDIFSEFVKAKPLRVFISEVLPGAVVPYHWDVEDKEKEWLNAYGQLYRYACCIDKPRIGAGLFFDEDYLYLNNQGDVFEWANYRDYHSSANSGEHPSYYFHFLGYKE